ncbi:MAG: hypothetical protein B6229_03365 [Spirochaetaceae bacterium 4572_7]|nr:MAG: hypothetical protein B6229_03365 [Spirochaetaceae bacterium 4572_7]
MLNGVYELSLDMSCPEAIRKLLSNKEKIKFIEKEINLDKYIIHSYVDTKDKRWSKSPVKHLKELRTMSINMIQNRELLIEKRLLNLGYKLNKNNSPEPLDNWI